MKRNILLALVAALTISLVAAGVAFAQGRGPGGNGTDTGAGVGINQDVTLSNYMSQAIADVLGLSVEDVNTRLASGETFYTIALAQGYTADQLSALMTSVRSKAVSLAATNGTLTTDQSTFLLNNQYGGNARGNGAGSASMYSTGTGSGTGLCDGTCVPQNYSSVTGGSMRRMGGRR